MWKRALNRRVFAVLLALAAIVSSLVSFAAPHPLLTAAAIATISRDATLEIAIRCDVLAFALDAPPQTIEDAAMLALLNGPRETLERSLLSSADRMRSTLEITIDGAPLRSARVESPTIARIEAWRTENASTPLPVKLEYTLHADLPRASSRVSLKFPAVLGDVVLTVQAPGEEPQAALVRAGERSDEYRYNLAAPVLPGTFPLRASHESSAASRSPPNAPPSTPPSAFPSDTRPAATPESAGETSTLPVHVASFRAALGFIRLGFTHIIPEGLDHILFVLGLFFLSPRPRTLLLQITCFTIAHSVTLALSARGVISLPSSIVEPAIAASIAFVAIENLWTQRVHAWRPLVVFGFGLIHGLGFASAFAEALGTSSGSPPRVPLVPVLLFNVGVECGQLAVVALAMLTVGWFRKRPWYRRRIAIPASLAIAAIGLYWTITRLIET
jgi:hypothetical protein